MYIKTNWVNQTTPLNADNLNKMETGIYNNSDEISALQTSVSSIGTHVTALDAAIAFKADKSAVYSMDYLNYRLDRAENYQKIAGSTVADSSTCFFELSGSFSGLVINDGAQNIFVNWSCAEDQVIVIDATATANRYSKSGAVETLTYSAWSGLKDGSTYSFGDELGGSVAHQMYVKEG